MRALITGGGGQLASDLATLLGEDARAFDRTELDITDGKALDRAFASRQPDVVFNCAAFHNVDICERNRALLAGERRSVRQLACAVGRSSTFRRTTYSTAPKAEAYTEDDLPSPRSVYALTKLAGEYAALGYCERGLVVRTAGLYGLHGSVSKGGNFVQRMVARAREQGALRMVADQRLQPTFTADLASAIVAGVDAGATGSPT